jgi:hypothetical protein
MNPPGFRAKCLSTLSRPIGRTRHRNQPVEKGRISILHRQSVAVMVRSVVRLHNARQLPRVAQPLFERIKECRPSKSLSGKKLSEINLFGLQVGVLYISDYDER